MEEKNRRESLEIGEEVASEYFIYTSKTKDADMPKGAMLTHLQVDSSVKGIPQGVFFGCDSLKYVRLPETLSRIGRVAFARCSKLKCVQFVSDGQLGTLSKDPDLKNGTIIFPESAVLQIDHRAFQHCYSLRKVIVCSNSTKLGEAAFYECCGLISVQLPEGLQVIEPWLFRGCRSLTTFKTPSSVTKIGDYAFCGCRSLTSFDLPHGLVEIGTSSFQQCVSIEFLQIPPTVSSIGNSAFNCCSGLKHIDLPPSLEKIESETFYGCYRLEYIELHAAVSFIGDYAFGLCRSLSHIRIPPNVERIVSTAFTNCTSLISVELPEGFLFDIDISQSLSLMNVAGPIDQSLFSGDDFHRDSMLGCIVDDYDDLVRRLNHRFDISPLNKLCYYQSYHSSEDTMLQLSSLMEGDPLAATTQVDEFGMTPLHILSLSQTPNLDMLLAVMNEGRADHIIHGTDLFGSTPMDYLCLNRMPNSTEVIRRVLQTRFDYCLGVEVSGQSDTIWQAVEEALAVNWSSRRREIGRVYFDLANYERNEILSLLELCLWKIKIDEISCKKEQIGDRESCRINCGASVVLPHVLPFLDKLQEEDYFAHSP
eukprot:scaffold70_cov102-Cylindrotheca_fusiformis.AAC.1